MPTAIETGWLYAFEKDSEWILAVEDSMQRALKRMSSSNQPYPSFALMVGGRSRLSALQRLVPTYTTKPIGIAHVVADRSSESPIVFLDVDVHELYRGTAPRMHRARQKRCSATWMSNSSRIENLVDAVFAQLLYSFVDVVCLFVDDFDSVDMALNLLQRWTRPSRSIARPWRPRLILITEKLVRSPRLSPFAHVQVIPDVPRAACERLRKTLHHSVNQVRKERSNCQMLLFTSHLHALMHRSFDCLATSAFTSSTLIELAYSPLLEQHTIEQLEQAVWICQKASISLDRMTTYIASALILSSYPPGMHREYVLSSQTPLNSIGFHAPSVFKTLHAATCNRVAQRCDLPEHWCPDLLAKFCDLELQLFNSLQPALVVHQHQLEILGFDWTRLKSSVICLRCLKYKPEHSARCGHSFCDNCIKIFGQPRVADYAFQLSHCMLCRQSADLVVRLKPPTAGSRLLVLDGGGVRGAFTLQALQALESSRNLPYLLYDEFDLVLGTSSGGLIVLMFLLRRTLADCVATFDTMASKVFARYAKRSWIGRLLAFFASLVTDSLYGAKGMEECVTEVYGADNTLFGGYSYQEFPSGLKYAVTTMSVADSKLCLLSNYNGNTMRQGYRHFRPSDPEDEVRLRDAAQATSAAPSYFPAKFIRGYGFVQDGGAGKHNNPINPAEWESQAIWQVSPDVVVSVGTGSTSSQPATVTDRLGLHGRFFPRLFRLFSASLDAQQHWDDHLNQFGPAERGKYFRVNMPLQYDLELDDVSKLSEIKACSHRFLHNYDFTGLIRAMYAAAFYFELRVPAVPVRSLYRCEGEIRCRSPNPEAMLTELHRNYPKACFLLDKCNLGSVSDATVSCEMYQKHVKFSRGLAHEFTIYLQFDPRHILKISGFPHCVASLVRMQMLDAEFGRPDHQTAQFASRGSFGKTALARRRKRCSSSLARKRRRTA